MKHYYLQKGDYLQIGDEFQQKDDTWKKISQEHVGRRFGFDRSGKQVAWPTMRRLVQDSFELPKPRTKIVMPVDEQYGEEFEF